MSSTLVDLTLQAPELDTPFLNVRRTWSLQPARPTEKTDSHRSFSPSQKFAGVKYADGSYTTALQKTWCVLLALREAAYLRGQKTDGCVSF
jgi:hypothetical protein